MVRYLEIVKEYSGDRLDFNTPQHFTDFGSYFKHQGQKAIHNSPIGKAMRDMKAAKIQKENKKTLIKQLKQQFNAFLKTYKPVNQPQQTQQNANSSVQSRIAQARGNVTPQPVPANQNQPQAQPVPANQNQPQAQPKRAKIQRRKLTASESLIYEFLTPQGATVQSIRDFLLHDEFTEDEIKQVLAGVTDSNIGMSLNGVFSKMADVLFASGRVNVMPHGSEAEPVDRMPDKANNRKDFYVIKDQILRTLGGMPPKILVPSTIVSNTQPVDNNLTRLAMIGNEVLKNQNLADVRSKMFTQLANAKIHSGLSGMKPIDGNTMSSQPIQIRNNFALIGNAFLGYKQ